MDLVPLSDDILNSIESEISCITASLRFNMIQTSQQNPIYNINNTYNLGMRTMHSIASAMSDMRLPETPDQFPRLPDVLLDKIFMYLTPIMMTSLRVVSRRFCYESRQINLRHSHQYYSGLTLWVMYSNMWFVGRILPCVNDIGVTEIIYNTHQVNEIHIQMESGTIAVKTVDVLAKISLLKVPPVIPKYVENKNFDDPHQVCSCGVYKGTCNDIRLSAPKSSCWVLCFYTEPPTVLEIGTVCKFSKSTRMQSHVNEAIKLEKTYGISYNKYKPFSKTMARLCIKSISEYKNIFRTAKPIYNKKNLYEFDDIYSNMEEEYYNVPSDDEITDMFD